MYLNNMAPSLKYLSYCDLVYHLRLMMHSTIFLGGLLLASSGASARRVKRADGPTDPGIASDCTFIWTSEAGDNCAKFESDWSISHDDFVEWVSR